MKDRQQLISRINTIFELKLDCVSNDVKNAVATFLRTDLRHHSDGSQLVSTDHKVPAWIMDKLNLSRHCDAEQQSGG